MTEQGEGIQCPNSDGLGRVLLVRGDEDTCVFWGNNVEWEEEDEEGGT